MSDSKGGAKTVSEGITLCDEQSRWRAVVGRRAEAARAFVYGVRTTGVYCRPNCASRVPRRENVEFFDGAAQAQRSGYRPCKRCRPQRSDSESPPVELVRRACRSIESAEESPSLVQLAAEVGLSASRFQRIFKEVCGVTPKQYAAAVQAQRVQQALLEGDSVTRAVYTAGFNSSSRFYEKSRRMLGMLPAVYGAGGKGETITYALAHTSLGWLLVAATHRGVCSMALGPRRGSLEKDLQSRFGNATVGEGGTEFRTWVQEIAARMERGGDFADLPLDIRGTAFMRRVWSALQEIPLGETRTYGQIAQAIGKPNAARAVANACANNPLAVAVPCHRVVRGDGGLGGYRWGAARKRKLLEREAERRQP